MRRIGIAVLALLLMAVVASAIGVVYARQQSRILFGELTRLTKDKDDLDTEFGRLQLELATAQAKQNYAISIPTARKLWELQRASSGEDSRAARSGALWRAASRRRPSSCGCRSDSSQ